MSLLEAQRQVADAQSRLAEFLTSEASARREHRRDGDARAELARLPTRVLDVRLALNVPELHLGDLDHWAEDSAVLADQFSGFDPGSWTR